MFWRNKSPDEIAEIWEKSLRSLPVCVPFPDPGAPSNNNLTGLKTFDIVLEKEV